MDTFIGLLFVAFLLYLFWPKKYGDSKKKVNKVFKDRVKWLFKRPYAIANFAFKGVGSKRTRGICVWTATILFWVAIVLFVGYQLEIINPL